VLFRSVELVDGRRVEFDRLLIATGTRARPWPNRSEAPLDGVVTLRTRADAARLRARLAAGPRRVLIVGGGFIGSEIASVGRELGLPVTVVERASTPVASALGQTVGALLAAVQRERGVDLRCGTTVAALEDDGRGRLRGARLSDGALVEADLAVVALGAVRNVEWLLGSGVAADWRGVVCDRFCRAIDRSGRVLDGLFAAGDVARWPHRLCDDQLVSVEHWSNAVEQARTAAHNMLAAPSDRRAHTTLPSFWSHQFGLDVKSVGFPCRADEVLVTQGRVEERRFVASYGRQGRLVAAVAFDQARWLPAYQALIEESAPFPPELGAAGDLVQASAAS